jgi:hypothetical protein
MSLFEMAADTRYRKVAFDDGELDVLRAACASASVREHNLMEEASDAGIEQYAVHAKRAGESGMADVLVTLFKPGQEILIEPEDLEPVLACLIAYGQSAPKEHVSDLKSAMEKIERCCRSV